MSCSKAVAFVFMHRWITSEETSTGWHHWWRRPPNGADVVFASRQAPKVTGVRKGVPVIFDGTHSVQAPGGLGTKSGGAGHFAPLLMRAAMAVGVEGLFLETHDDWRNALSDGPNVVPSKELGALLKDLKAIHRALGRPSPPIPR